MLMLARTICDHNLIAGLLKRKFAEKNSNLETEQQNCI